MSLSIRKKSRHNSTVPTDSLSDVAFLLIIFFIVTTSIRKLTGFTADIPAAQKSEQQQLDKIPVVKIHDQSVMYKDTAITIDGLRATLRQLNLPGRSGNDRIILLEATGKVDYQHYFEVMSAISAAGGIVGVVSEEKSEKKQ